MRQLGVFEVRESGSWGSECAHLTSNPPLFSITSRVVIVLLYLYTFSKCCLPFFVGLQKKGPLKCSVYSHSTQTACRLTLVREPVTICVKPKIYIFIIIKKIHLRWRWHFIFSILWHEQEFRLEWSRVLQNGCHGCKNWNGKHGKKDLSFSIKTVQITSK